MTEKKIVTINTDDIDDETYAFLFQCAWVAFQDKMRKEAEAENIAGDIYSYMLDPE